MSLKVTRGVLFQKGQTQLWMEFRQSRFGDTSTWVTLLWVDDGCFVARHFFVVEWQLVEFSIGRMAQPLSCIAVNWHIGQLTQWSNCTAVNWHSGPIALRSIGTSVQWHSGWMALQSNCTSVKWHIGQMAQRSNGTEVESLSFCQIFNSWLQIAR